MMLLIRSMSTGAIVLLTRQQVLALARRPSSIFAQRRRRLGAAACGCGRRALDELLADQRLRPDRCSARPCGSPRSRARRCCRTTAAFLSGVTSSDVDLADLDAGDLHVLARDDEDGVVEDRAHLVAASRRAAPMPTTAATARRRRATSRRWRRRASWAGRHLGRVAVELAGRRRATAPSRPRGGWHGGARAALDVARSGRPARRSAAGCGVEHAARPGCRRTEGVEDRLDARVVAVRVVVRGALAEVAQPADEVGRVRPDELEHRLALLQRL